MSYMPIAELLLSPPGFYHDATPVLAVRFDGEDCWHQLRASRMVPGVRPDSELGKRITEWITIAVPNLSEPAEPTTRQDELIEKAAKASWESWQGKERRRMRALFDLGLLADPAQTTELEELRRRATAFEKQWMETQDELDDRQKFVRDVAAERDEARAQRNEAMQTAAQLRDEVRERQVAAANLYGSVFVALGLSIVEPWTGLADAAGVVRSERDALRAELDEAYLAINGYADVIEGLMTHRDRLSLLLRGMARKLVATRRGARLQAELSLEINLTGERDTLEKILSKERRRVDAALALIDAGTSTGPYFLSPDETRAVRAALVGDQPGELPSELSSDLERAPDAPTELGALSGEALRDVEEADDAAEPACECFVVPEEQWTRHYDATEPGSMVEQNPDCPVHPAKQADDAAGDLP